MDEHYVRLEQMFHGSGQPSVRIDPVHRRSRIGVGGHTRGGRLVPPGLAVHAVVYYWALEVATYFAAASVVDDAFLVNVNLEADITGPVGAGTLTARGELVSRSRRVLLAQGVITDDDGTEVGRGRGLFVPTGRNFDEVG